MGPDGLRGMRFALMAAPAWLALSAIPAAAGASIPKRPLLRTAPAPGQAASPALPDTALTRAVAYAQAGDCRSALALLDPLVVGTTGAGTPTRFAEQMVRMPCLGQVGRAGEVPAVLAELKAQAPTNPLIQGYQVFVDVDGGRFAAAADGLGQLADQRSKALALMPGDLWRSLAQQLTISHDYARRDRVALSLAQAEWQPSDQPDLPDALAADGVGTLMDRKELDEARDLLDHVSRPELVWQMAIERRYAPIWPQVEARLGPQGGAAADHYAQQALANYGNGPEDDHGTLAAARAFLVLGRYEDVAAAATPTTIKAGMSEDQVDIVLTHARALAASGDRVGEIARLNPFASLDLRATPNAASALISLAEALDEAGRFDEELALARGTMSGKRDYFSSFGLAWLKRSEVCALAGLHREVEAKAAADVLKASVADNEPAAVEGLLCAGRDADAATIAIAALSTEEGTDRIADQFQPGGALYAPAPSRLRALWARLLARPDVKTAFEKSARILPRGFWPSTTPRDVPVLPGSGGPTT